jgi:hypothetical protein
MKYMCEAEKCGKEIVGRVYHCTKCNKLFCQTDYESHGCGSQRVFKTGVIKEAHGSWRHDKR